MLRRSRNAAARSLGPLWPSRSLGAVVFATASVLGLSLLPGVTGPAQATESTAAVAVHEASFHGQMSSDRRSGNTDSGACNEIVTSGAGAGTFKCRVTFKLTKSICSFGDGQRAGYADFYSRTNTPASSHHGPITLFGVGDAGSGVVTGYYIDFTDPQLIQITIDAADECGALEALAGLGIGDGGGGVPRTGGAFTGNVDYV